MNNTRWLKTVVFIAAVTVCFFILFSGFRASHPSEGDVQRLGEGLSTPEGVDDRSSSDLDDVLKGGVGHSESTFDPNSVQSVRDDFNKIVSASESGDLSASAAFVALDLKCGSLSKSYGLDVATLGVLQTASEEDRVRRQEALDALKKYCDIPLDDADSSVRIERIEVQMREAAAGGDEIAQIWLGVYLGEPVEDAVLLRHTASRVPWIAEMSLQGVIASGDTRLKAIDDRIFKDSRGSMSSAEIQALKMAAAKWRACELGASCGAGGYYQSYECLYGSGYCNQAIGVRDYIRHQFNAREFEAMMRYLEEIKKLAASTP